MKLMKNLYGKAGNLLAMMCLTSCATVFTGTKAHMVLEGERGDTLTIQTPQQTLSQVTLPHWDSATIIISIPHGPSACNMGGWQTIVPSSD